MTSPLPPMPSGARTPSFVESIIPFVAVAVLLILGYGILGMRIEILLLIAMMIAGFLGWRLGISYQAMQQGVLDSIHKSMSALLIVIVVGALIAAWIACGTIPFLIYHGLQLISPAWFLVTSCVVCSIVSLITGTSWGTAGTVGIALMGVAQGLGINPAYAAGAIISGAYFGDKMSLFSDTTNLAPAAAGSNIYDHVGHMLWTTTPAYILTLVVYGFLGKGASEVSADSDFQLLLETLRSQYVMTGFVGVLLLIPPIITLAAAIWNRPVIPSMLASCAVAWLIAVSFQGAPPVPPPGLSKERVAELQSSSLAEHLSSGVFVDKRDALRVATWPVVHPLTAMVTGYQLSTGVESADQLLSRGGMQSMMNTMLVAIAAFGFAGVMASAGFLGVLMDTLSRFATTRGKLIFATVCSCIGVALCTGSSYLSILLPGELFAPLYKKMGLAAKNLSRTTEDCGTVVVPLIPWSVAGVYMSGILGVEVLDYAPWAIFCYSGVAVALFYGFTGIRIAPKIKDDETQPGS
ncbi:MAG: Na+/H+ antiporter NhaC family protein [Candidatus Sumerlaeia bacterium]|nr:Na+/H+ antiporter NhaC family protein [Candidatus Sumerlaeia bacterium]